MENKTAIEAFAKRLFSNYEIRYFESAAEIRTQHEVAYIILYNGHFWDAAEFVWKYLGPNAQIASIRWMAQITGRSDRSIFHDHENELLDAYEKAACEDGHDWDDDDDAVSGLSDFLAKFNPEKTMPGVGDPIFKVPKEWSERLNYKNTKWQVWDTEAGKPKKIEPPEESGFGTFAHRVQEIFQTKVHSHVFKRDGDVEYACELTLGFNEDGDPIIAYLVHAGGAYHDTNRGQFMTLLGVDPTFAAEHFCYQLGCYPDDSDDEFDFEVYEMQFEERLRADFDNYNSNDRQMYYPEHWNEVFREDRQDSPSL